MTGFPAPHSSMQVHLAKGQSLPGEIGSDPIAPQASSPWRAVMLLGWVGGILGYSTVWLVSRQIGLPTWWLGPRSQPTPLYIVALPFVLPVLMLFAISLNLKRLGLYGVAAACATVVIAAGDAQTQPGLAIIQLAVSAGLLCTSLATLIASSTPRSEKKRKTASTR